MSFNLQWFKWHQNALFVYFLVWNTSLEKPFSFELIISCYSFWYAGFYPHYIPKHLIHFNSYLTKHLRKCWLYDFVVVCDKKCKWEKKKKHQEVKHTKFMGLRLSSFKLFNEILIRLISNKEIIYKLTQRKWFKVWYQNYTITWKDEWTYSR